MLETVTISYPVAFLAGIVSFLSPCVLPVVPGYLTFVSGMTLEEMESAGGVAARRVAAVHTLLFGIGFGLVFMTLGATASALGQVVSRALPWMMRLGGILVAVFGLYLLGVIRGGPLGRERRVDLARRPAGAAGSVLIGMAFGAGWTPCIGPILGTILLYASLDTTVVQGTLLLAVYALGLGVPFVVAALGINWFLSSMKGIQRWILPLQRASGIILLVIGILMASGQFAALTRTLAGMGQLINLELQ